MTSAPKKNIDADERIRTTLRVPAPLYDSLQESAMRNGHSMNAEILGRLEGKDLHELKQQNLEIMAMLRDILDKI